MYLRKKAKKLCLMGQIVIESHSFLEYCRALNEMGGTTPPPQKKTQSIKMFEKSKKMFFSDSVFGKNRTCLLFLLF